MRVLIVLPNDTLGGAEQFLKQITVEHLKRGDHVEVLFLSKIKSSAWDDITNKLFHLKYARTRFPQLGVIWLFFCLLFRSGFDRAYTSHVLTNGAVGLFRKLKVIRLRQLVGRESTMIFQRYNGIKLLYYKFFYRIGYGQLDLLICQSDMMRRQIQSNLSSLLAEISVIVLGNPVNFKLQRRIREQQQKSTNNPSRTIVSAGRLIPEKGFDLLIRSFAALEDSETMELIILGEGPERDRLEHEARQMGIADCVHLPGFVQDVYPFFFRAECCVVSSRVEGFPNVLLQMMSQNTNVVSTLCAGGISTIPGMTIVPTEDVKKLTEAIQFVLIDNTDQNRKLFDDYLLDRDIGTFVDRLENILTTKD